MPRRFQPPLVEGVEVLSVTRVAGAGRGFEVMTSQGRMTADQVVVATGSYHLATIPAMGARFPADVSQVHSAHYRNPQSLPEGDVLVVGSGQSGCQIAEDLHLAGRRVHLCVGNAPRCAASAPRQRRRRVAPHDGLLRAARRPAPATRSRSATETNHYVTGRDGGRDIDLRKFALEGMRLYGALRDVKGSIAEFAPGLKRNLDDADDVYRSINRTIDEFIQKQGIDAPPGAVYQPLVGADGGRGQPRRGRRPASAPSSGASGSAPTSAGSSSPCSTRRSIPATTAE